jgi:hypothetical protein
MVENEDLAKIEALLERAEIEAAGLVVLREEIENMREAIDALEEAVRFKKTVHDVVQRAAYDGTLHKLIKGETK